MELLGFNWRLSDVHAALGASQMGKLEGFLDCRRALAARYEEALVRFQRPAPDPGHAWHLYPLRVPEGRDALMRALAERGIGTQVHYEPVPLNPWFAERVRGAWPRAVEHARTTLSLPMHPALSDAQQERVIDALDAWNG